MGKIICIAVLALLVGLVHVAGATVVATIGFAPNGLTNWDVYVRLSSDAPTQIVAAYNLDIRYNSSTLTAVNFSSKLGSAPAYEVLQDSSLAKSGVVNIAAVSLLSDADLQALQGTGARDITLATLMFNNPSASPTADWSTTAGLRDVKGLQNAVISDMSTVPEPATYLLAAIAGMVVLAAARKRREKTATA